MRPTQLHTVTMRMRPAQLHIVTMRMRPTQLHTVTMSFSSSLSRSYHYFYYSALIMHCICAFMLMAIRPSLNLGMGSLT